MLVAHNLVKPDYEQNALRKTHPETTIKPMKNSAPQSKTGITLAKRVERFLNGFGKAIEDTRLKRGLTLLQLDGLDNGNISRIENGIQWVSAPTLLELSRVLNIPAWVFVAAGEGEISAKELEFIMLYRNTDEVGRAFLDHVIKNEAKKLR